MDWENDVDDGGKKEEEEEEEEEEGREDGKVGGKDDLHDDKDSIPK